MTAKSIRTAQLNIRDGMIDFGPGQPGPGQLPLALLKEASEHRLNQDDASLLAYGAEQGDGYFRIALAEFLSQQYQAQVAADRLFVTAGASAGLDLICSLFTKAGDSIFVEEPSYFLALQIFADHGLKIISLPMDEKGLIIKKLEKKLSKQAPVFLYTIPTFHNPSSVTLSAARRKRLIQLSKEYGFLIVADEVYHLLSYRDVPPAPLANHVEIDSILSLGSFSKIMAPGLRLGWIQTGPQLMGRLAACGLLKSGGGLNPFTSSVIRSAIELGLQEKQLEIFKSIYSARKIALSRALREHLPACIDFIEPDGGFYFWLKFPVNFDTDQMLAVARRNNVGYLPGSRCSSCKGLDNYARLSFSYFDALELEEGARRLAEVINNYMNNRERN